MRYAGGLMPAPDVGDALTGELVWQILTIYGGATQAAQNQ